MSKESYARGFVKAAAAAGVDPVELAKFAQEKRRVHVNDDAGNDDAGIGSVADNFGTKYRIAHWD